MTLLSVNSEALATSAMVEGAGASTLAAGAAAATEPMTGVVPAGPGPVLAALAVAANVRGGAGLLALAMLTGSKELYSSAIAVSGLTYEAVSDASKVALTV